MSRPYREDQPPNPYPRSESAKSLEDFLDQRTDAIIQAVARAKATAGGLIGSAASGVADAMAPNERQLAAQAAWSEKLRAARSTPGILEQLIAQLRGPQMSPAIPRGSLAEILNAQRVANPNPSHTPPPLVVGVRD